MITIGRFTALLLLVNTLACATTSGSSSPRGDRNIITREQLQQHNFPNAYEAVQSLHSNWLNAKGPDSFNNPTQVLVYFDNSRLGGVETLRSISIVGISYIQHFDGITAAACWGLDHGQGVIYVSTRPQGGASDAARR